MKKKYIILIVLAIVIIVAIITNPTPKAHREAVKAEVTAYMQKTMNGADAGLGQGMSMVLGGALANMVIANVVNTDNYVLFSTTKITWMGKTKTIGVGAFGHVFLFAHMDNLMDNKLIKE